MKALLIEFNVTTGQRPAGIEANDPKLQCYGWQNLEVNPCLEIRVIEDDRDISQYEGKQGITVLFIRLSASPLVVDKIAAQDGDRLLDTEPLLFSHPGYGLHAKEFDDQPP